MSKKIYKGYELIKAIADGEIKEGSRFLTYNGKMEVIYKGNALWDKDGREEVGNSVIIKQFFELIEDETIDIESINELETYSDDGVEFYDKSDIHKIAKKTNEILQAVKQLNKEIKELKSLDIEISEKEINKALERARNKEYCQVCGVELTEENKYMKNMCYDCKYEEE